MKKLIAISVMCALVAGAAFADTTVGGAIFVGGELLNGTSEEGSFPGTKAINKDDYNTLIKLTFGDNSAGGWLSIHNNNGNYYHWFGWWRPIPQVRVQIGRNSDGDFGTAQITGWGFTGESKNGLGALGEYSGPIFGLAHARTGFYGGTGDTPNYQVSIFAIEGLTINLWIPFNNTQAAGFTFSKFHANIVYRIVDVGNVTLSYQSDTGYLEADEDSWWKTEQTGTPKVFLSFFLTAIENMAVDLGLAYKFPLTYSNDVAAVNDEFGYETKAGYKTNYNENFPFEVGLGFRYTAGDFGFKLRAGFSLGGDTTKTDVTEKIDGAANPSYLKDVTVNKPLQISVNILPTYKIGANTIYFYAGMGIQSIEDWEKADKGSIWENTGSNAVVSWFINPYLFIPAGSLRFQVGFQLYSDGVGYPYKEGGKIKYDAAKINWAIPIGFYTYF